MSASIPGDRRSARRHRSLISPLLRPDDAVDSVDPDTRERLVHTDTQGRTVVLVELTVARGRSAPQMRTRFVTVFDRAFGGVADRPPPPVQVSSHYMQCRLRTDSEVATLLAQDSRDGGQDAAGRSIYRIWPDYVVRAHLDRSTVTVNADSAIRSYAATGEGIVWAVIDSGIDGSHPHFGGGSGPGLGTLSDPAVADLHRDFTGLVTGLVTGFAPEPATDPPGGADGAQPADPPVRPRPADGVGVLLAAEPALATVPTDPAPALIDNFGHGTHVAGIIAGAAPTDPDKTCIVTNRPSADDLPVWVTRRLSRGRTLSGVSPRTKLVSLKVLTDDGLTLSSAVIAAMEYIRQANADGRRLVIHGVNLSIGCDWYPDDFAAGQSPLCRELDLLVATGVVVVVSAGNDGAGGTLMGRSGDVYGRLSTITDPGNAARAITVGSTHSTAPHTYGVTYTSSKGPTLDGRLKPDLVAPGEHITSAAAGQNFDGIPPFAGLDPAAMACYIEDSGTSMAAPHVSGAIAAFLSVRDEFIGQPDVVKQMFLANASSLGRHEFHQGAGLVDLMRVLSNV